LAAARRNLFAVSRLETFCFYAAKYQFCKRQISPLSIFGTPIDQQQGIEVKGGLTWKINSSHSTDEVGNIRCWPISTGSDGAVPARSLARHLSSHYSFIGYLLECIEFYICFLTDFLSFCDEHALFSCLAFTRPGLQTPV